MKPKNYYKEIIISLIAAIAVGIVFNALIGLVSFFIIGSMLSKGSVPKEEMESIINTDDNSYNAFNDPDYMTDPTYSHLYGNIHNND